MTICNGLKNSEIDLVIVGAGAAGLAAAFELGRLGVSHILLEAKSRIGGRTFTESDSLGVPFDHGAYWMHSASLNPYVGIADSLGFAYRKMARRRRVFMRDRWAGDEELREREVFFDRNLEAVMAAGLAGKDLAYTEVLEKEGRWRPLLNQWIGAVNGVDPEDASTLDHANYRDTGENWPVRDGFGALVARFGSDVCVEIDTAAERIDWRGPGVHVETRKGVIAAQGVILTVSTGVLASDLIRFAPLLPEWKTSAIDVTPMGKANKVAFHFSRDVFDLPEDSSATVLVDDSKTLGFQIKHFGRNTAIGYLGGRFCSELESAGREAMRDFAMEQLKRMFGSELDRKCSKWAATSWESDPFIRGGYSAAKPGEAHRRADLATPVGDRLFFAGEATSKEFFSTVHGAYFSGIDAARLAASTLCLASIPESEE